MIPLSWDEVYFAQKWAFWLVALVAVSPLVFRLLDQIQKTQSGSRDFVSPTMHDKLLSDGTQKARFQPWANGLMWASALLVALALTRPQWGLLEQTVQQKGLDIVIAVDLSSSMRATDISPSRIENARRELAFLVEELKGNRIGLVGFAGSAFLFCPLTLDTDAVELFLDEMTIEAVPVPGTALGGGGQRHIPPGSALAEGRCGDRCRGDDACSDQCGAGCDIGTCCGHDGPFRVAVRVPDRSKRIRIVT